MAFEGQEAGTSSLWAPPSLVPWLCPTHPDSPSISPVNQLWMLDFVEMPIFSRLFYNMSTVGIVGW